MVAGMILRITLLFGLVPISQGVFTEDFKAFLQDRYGSEAAAKLERTDMGLFKDGSFGGKENPNDTIYHQPIIFVHGLTSRASFWEPSYEYFMKTKNYSSAELYATTYGEGGLAFVVKSQSSCESIKQIRKFIQAVYAYTLFPIDIIAHSLGVAVTRKAILGGKCVDTNETLGSPLTPYIDTFVSVGGVGYGAEACPMFLKACNDINGFDCKSKLINDINTPSYRYEGRYSFYIYSVDDLIIGKNCCGHFCPQIKNANNKSEHKILNHLTIVTKTMDIQYAMLKYHMVVKEDVDKGD